MPIDIAAQLHWLAIAILFDIKPVIAVQTPELADFGTMADFAYLIFCEFKWLKTGQTFIAYLLAASDQLPRQAPLPVQYIALLAFLALIPRDILPAAVDAFDAARFVVKVVAYSTVQAALLVFDQASGQEGLFASSRMQE
jgi:kynureninase